MLQFNQLITFLKVIPISSLITTFVMAFVNFLSHTVCLSCKIKILICVQYVLHFCFIVI